MDEQKTPKIVSNKVYEQLQPATLPSNYKPLKGTVLYANQYSGIGKVEMPEALKEIFNSDDGEIGKNVIVQLKQKVNLLQGGPWYVDNRNGVIYIHNHKFVEPSLRTYTYQGGAGELLQINFETQYITKTAHSNGLAGIDLTKAFGTGITANEYRLFKKDFSDYNIHDKASAISQGYNAQEDYLKGDLSYGDLEIVLRRAKEFNVVLGPYQQSLVNKKKREEDLAGRDAMGNKTDTYEMNEAMSEYHSLGNSSKAQNKKRALELLETGDINSLGFESDRILGQKAHGNQEILQEFEREIQENITRGTIEEYFKYNFKEWHTIQTTSKLCPKIITEVTYNVGTEYKRRHPEAELKITMFGAGVSESLRNEETIKSWRAELAKEFHSEGCLVKFVPGQSSDKITVYELKRDRTMAFPQYDILIAYYTRKYNLKRGSDGKIMASNASLDARVFAAANNHSRKYTVKKLTCKMKCVGNPALKTHINITINNVGKRWSGVWYIMKCTHQLTPGEGYTCMLELVKSAEASARHKSATGKVGMGTKKGSNEGNTNSSKVYADSFTRESVMMDISNRNYYRALQTLSNAYANKGHGARYDVNTSSNGNLPAKGKYSQREVQNQPTQEDVRQAAKTIGRLRREFEGKFKNSK